MNREILFRGKRVDNGEWIYGDLLTPTDIMDVWEISENTGMGDRYEIDPETSGQYTGLTDKNGTKIFEGDIVKEEDCVHNGEVQIVGDVWQIGFKNAIFYAHNKREAKFVYWLKNFKVIGNIYDNPELMEETE